MARRRNREGDRAEALVKLVVGGILLLALGIGGLKGLAGILNNFLILIVGGVLLLAAILVGRRFYRRGRVVPPAFDEGPVSTTPAQYRVWTEARIAERLRKIDWYQFEKLNAEILRNEGWAVERKGGASPDGGVDLIATKGGVKMLVQCKHWRTWSVQEKVIREMLGSMTHFGVSTGAIHTLKGWTAPAARFAGEHNIALCDSADLVRRASMNLGPDGLDRCLLGDTHHCPKCEAEMIWRTGDFKPFWGCSRYPRCRSVFKEQVEVVGG